MVKVVYDIENEKIVEEVVESNFLLTNKNGGFFLDYKTTKYRGLFVKNKDNLFKSVDTLSISGVPSEAINKLWCFEKKYYKEIERFFMHEDSLLYEVENYNGYSLLTLDMREVNDFSTQGKDYGITSEGDFIIIKFNNKNDVKYLAIKSNCSFKPVKEWIEHEYPFDIKRKNPPNKWFVFKALKFEIKGNATISLSFSDDKEKAKSDANTLFYSHEHLKSKKKNEINSLFRQKKMSKHLRVAYKCVLKSLDDLIINVDNTIGMYAGLPWFYQIWTRDEAISLGGLLSEKNYSAVKEMLTNLLKDILPDGRVPNRYPHSSLGSADGVGWAFKRLSDIFYELQLKRSLNEVFLPQEIANFTTNLKTSIERLQKYYIKNNMTINRKKETWMDTDAGVDPRDGARIEIQAMTLNMIKLAKNLCKYIDDPDYKMYVNLEKELKKTTRNAFMNQGYLNDGFNDPTIRPNIFLAYYIYPELLTEREWKKVFKNSLEHLWLKWGGLSTIDKRHPLFKDEYSGMDDSSYHRGDSWFFINNLTCICLYRVDKKLFHKYITKILEASTDEILRMGALGCHSEISSAKEKSSEGAISQAWSAATYIELINELFGK